MWQIIKKLKIMKRIFTIAAVLMMTASVWAQSPYKMSYQAVVRDASDALVATQAVGMQLSILQGSTSGSSVYTETHTPTTNINGLVSLEIGTGTTTDNFATIDWSAGPYFIKTETDPTGGTTYTITGTSQLMSVPYALHANVADSIVGGVSITETDPVFGASIANGITATDTANWNNHTVDTDTQLDSTGITTLGFTAGAHTVDTDTHIDSTGIATLGYVVGGITTETDPIFGASLASGITGTDTTYWNNKLTTEIDGSVTNEIQTISRTGTTVTLSNGGGTFTDSVNTYTAGTNITISTSNVISATSGSSGHYVGELFGGGIVFYVYNNGANGLIASLDDLDGGSGVAWSGNTTTLIGATAQSFYDGASNTAAMIVQDATANKAGTFCDSYTGGSQTDWYLPASWELNLLYNSAFSINTILENDGNGTTNGLNPVNVAPTYARYWSSTEASNGTAWVYNIDNSYSLKYNKSDTYRVRAVRAF
ncbi:MAG: hypothetical protein ACI87N_001765 [Flavobacteriales bacterium]|jgi:hypothetical protein